MIFFILFSKTKFSGFYENKLSNRYNSTRGFSKAGYYIVQSLPPNRYDNIFKKPQRFKEFASLVVFLVDNFRKFCKKIGKRNDLMVGSVYDIMS